MKGEDSGAVTACIARDRGHGHPASRSSGTSCRLTPEEFFKSGIATAQAACVRQFGKRFEELAATEADVFLLDVAGGKISDAGLPLQQWFNELVYPLFVQACSADPLYGGNRGKVFWKLVGYPGLPAFHTQDMIVYRGKPLKRVGFATFPAVHLRCLLTAFRR